MVKLGRCTDETESNRMERVESGPINTDHDGGRSVFCSASTP